MSPPILSLSAALVLALAPDGSYRDITFPPRTSHDSITYGPAGVFVTAEGLARWTHALFHAKVIGAQSLAHVKPGSSFAILGGGVEGPVGGVFTPTAAPS